MTNLAKILVKNLEEVPEQIAITLLFQQDPPVSLTYAGLLSQAVRYQRVYAEKGFEPGDVILLILDHSVDLIAAFTGAILHGVIPAILPFLTEKLSPERYRESLTALLMITRPAGVVSSLDLAGDIQPAIAKAPSHPVLIITDQVPADLGSHLHQIRKNNAGPDEIVLLQHSSGTTGLQKGVALSHDAVLNHLDSYTGVLGLNSNDVIVSWLPLYHDMGLIAGFVMPLLYRSHLVLISPFDWVRAPYRLLEAVSHYRGTLTWLPNFAYNFCASKIRDRHLQGINLSSLRAVINCSEPMYKASHELFLNRFKSYGLKKEALATSYAMAENVFAVTQGGLGEEVKEITVSQSYLQEKKTAKPAEKEGDAVTLVSAGTAIPGVQIRILDEDLHALPELLVGEISLKSNSLLNGYYKRPDIDKTSFTNGWFLTGDLGFLADGELYVTGRKKDLIIVGGKNIYPQDIENLVNTIPGIHPGRTVAFGVYSRAQGTEEVILLAETDLQPGPESETLSDQVRLAVSQASEIAISEVHFLPKGWLLKTSSGKIARGANREKYLTEIRPRS